MILLVCFCDDLTKGIDDEIMGLKEQLYEEGYSNDEVSRAIEEATKTYNAETPPTDIEEFEREIRGQVENIGCREFRINR